MKKTIPIAFLALALLLTPRLASAHTVAIACLPRMGSTVSKPPAEVICQFTQPLQAATVSLKVTNGAGERVDKNDTRLYPDDDYTIIVSLDTTKMPAGIYTAAWQVTDTLDLGTTNGSFQFGVNTVVPPTPTPALPGFAMTPTPVQPASNPATDLIARFLIGLGAIVLVAVGILFWRMRASSEEPGAPADQE